MSTSFIEYGGFGFWSFDLFTERLIDDVADLLITESADPWEMDLASHWKVQASGGFSGWMHLELNERVADETRRQRLSEVVGRAAEKYPAADPIHKTGMLLQRLLKGDIQWNSATPPDYMVT